MGYFFQLHKSEILLARAKKYFPPSSIGNICSKSNNILHIKFNGSEILVVSVIKYSSTKLQRSEILVARATKYSSTKLQRSEILVARATKHSSTKLQRSEILVARATKHSLHQAPEEQNISSKSNKTFSASSSRGAKCFCKEMKPL